MSDSEYEIKYEIEIPDVLQALGAVEGAIAEHSVDRKLLHLVKLRASQINQCGYCIKLHTKEARQDGESNERLDRVIAWRHVDDFSDSEKTAFEWTEALTQLDKNTDYETLRRTLKMYFTDSEISILTAIITMINLWNRFQISKH
ncbi:carboxymuconolactone decarboxylase family protein [Paremcibacter congregatus]|uniref:Alkylhydroperoxidase n=1 Tax=Paremcibacter congregatus TaxID=2043170 RepID=A0A2G4YNJ3_9PROT|nr:carboxymuconolactone decarboxylase family protein [Paremcibacter congregatus]PHZ83877.1 alkylhydroperoxidase [Paremcibacter congregatus]QDE27582.1 carboxymuconolactone decarboxylase family protein [Paremcibacter congregatus]